LSSGPLYGQHPVGTSTIGDWYRCRYYTCFSRQRDDATFSAPERLPAEELERQSSTRCSPPLNIRNSSRRQVSAARRRASSQLTDHGQEQAVVDTGIVKGEEAVERYLSGLEAATLPKTECGKRPEGFAPRCATLASGGVRS
jgi:site-specific DNA recombinase